MKKIVICNQKGGVGKTSITSNLIAGLNYYLPEKRKLAIDLDPQGATSFILGDEDPDYIKLDKTVYRLFQDEPHTPRLKKAPNTFHKRDCIAHECSRFDNTDIIPANILLFKAQQNKELIGENLRLQTYLSNFKLELEYDIAIIDTPPNLDLFVMNALRAADYVLIPTDLEFLSVRGITVLFDSIDDALKDNPDLKILGVLPNKLNNKLREHKEIMDLLRNACGDILLESLSINTNAPLSRAIKSRKTIFEADKKARSYRQFKDLTAWVIDTCGLDE